MVLRPMILLAFLFLISGCVHRAGKPGEPGSERSTFLDVYHHSGEGMMRPEPGALLARAQVLPGADESGPYLPVVRPGKVIRAWIPAHVVGGDRRALVSGHWVYVMLDEFQWFLEDKEAAWGQ